MDRINAFVKSSQHQFCCKMTDHLCGGNCENVTGMLKRQT